MIVNLECVVAVEGTGKKSEKKGSKIWHLRASPHMLEVFPKNKITIVSIANNHSMDYGSEALMEMVNNHFSRYNILFAGGGKNAKDAEKPLLVEINGLKIAYYSFTAIEKEFRATTDKPGYNWITDQDVKRFRIKLNGILERTKNDSDLQFFAVHWGKNYSPSASPIFQQMAKTAVDMGFDLIIGHSAHINHGIEVYKGVPIFYDLGNFLVDFKFLGWDDKSIMPMLVLDKSGVKSIELLPINLREKAVNIAIGKEAQTILRKIEQLSTPYDTRITQIKGKGYVVIPK